MCFPLNMNMKLPFNPKQNSFLKHMHVVLNTIDYTAVLNRSESIHSYLN